MYLLKFSFRRLLRHWRINILIFAGMVLTGALVAGLPAYAQVIAAQTLERTIEAEPAFSRNLVISAGPEITTFNAALQQVLDNTLGFLVTDRIEVREFEYSAYISPDGNPDSNGIPNLVHLWAFSKLNQDTIVVEGRVPNHISALSGPTALIEPQPVEAAISLQVSNSTGLKVGDVMFDPLSTTRFEIVGILEPVNPSDERWFEDPRPFELEIELGLNEDITTIPLLLNSRSMAEFFPTSQRSWRLLVDPDLINPINAERIRSGIENAQAGFAIYGTDLTSGIPLLLDNYQAQLEITRVALLLLTAQALIFVFYTLGMITSFMLDRSRTEIATLSSRGAQQAQMISLFTIEGFLLTLPGAALFGPPLVGIVLRQWVNFSGVQISTTVSSDAWLLSLSAAIVGWITFVLPGITLIGRGVVEHQQARARPPQNSVWQARNIDIFMLILSGLAYWQLSEKGSFVMRRIGETSLADPLLLLGPSLLLVAIALISLRFFPWILKLIRTYFSQGRGLILPIGLARLARDPISSARVILLITLAAGLTIFSITFQDSLDARQAEMAKYLAGADLRVSTKRTKLETIQNLAGVRNSSVVYRMRVQGPKNNFITLLAIDPNSFSKASSYVEGIGGGVPLEEITNLLKATAPSGSTAAIFSRSALPTDIGLSNETTIQIVQQNLSVEVRGIIQEFPTLQGNFVIINFREIENLEQLTSVSLAQEEAWLTLADNAYPGILENFRTRSDILGDSQDQLAEFRANTLAEGGKKAFALNALIMGVLSIAGFMIVHYFTAQGRAREFSVLRAGGLTGIQLLYLLFVEGLIVMLLGLFSGTLVGLGLSLVMRPFLSRIFALALSGALVERIVIDWAAIGQVFGLLAGFYALALLISVLALMRMGVHKVLRVSVE